jgi:hypothetical protein
MKLLLKILSIALFLICFNAVAKPAYQIQIQCPTTTKSALSQRTTYTMYFFYNYISYFRAQKDGEDKIRELASKGNKDCSIKDIVLK